jgi:hypothetical protein
MRSTIFLAAFAVGLSSFSHSTRAATPLECTIFSAAEVSRYLGEPVQAGRAGSLGEGCVWHPVDDDSDGLALLQMFPKPEGDNPRGHPRYEDRPDLGEQGYIVKDLSTIGSFTGGVVVGEHFYRVFLNGPTTTKAQTLEWLKKIAARR